MDTTNTLTEAMPIRRGTSRIVGLFALVALADFLIFGEMPGINLFLFALAVCAGILLLAGKIRAPSIAALLFGFSVLASAPLLEAPSLTGIAPLPQRADSGCSRRRQAYASQSDRSAAGVSPFHFHHSLAACRRF
ncbi:putative membrane protein YccC [Rhizobium brockwellii]